MASTRAKVVAQGKSTHQVRATRALLAGALLVMLLLGLATPGAATAVVPPGTAWGWGHDQRGQLGDGTLGGPDRVALPQQIGAPTARLTGIVALAAGTSHSLALKEDGTVWAWGSDTQGQLGDGTFVSPVNATSPQPVPNLTGIVAIAAAVDQSLALKADGTIWSWGGGTVANPSAVATPQQVTGIDNVVAIATSGTHSLAIRRDGTVWAWGSDVWGKLGDGTIEQPGNVATPQRVDGLADIVAIAADFHNLALAADGTVWSWGLDGDRQLGHGIPNAPIASAIARPVAGLSGVVAIAAGGLHSLALKADGTVWAWGNDALGQLGDGALKSPDQEPLPQRITGLSNVVAIAAGRRHSLALVRDADPRVGGTVWGWGDDSAGQLGDGTAGSPSQVSTPQRATGMSNVVAIVAGEAHSLAIISTAGSAPSPLPGLPATGGGAASSPSSLPWLLLAFVLLVSSVRSSKHHRRMGHSPE